MKQAGGQCVDMSKEMGCAIELWQTAKSVPRCAGATELGEPHYRIPENLALGG